MKIALIGDFDPAIVAHQAIPLALGRAGTDLGLALTWEWIGTAAIGDPADRLRGAAGVWCVPGSPYHSFDGALRAIRQAREARVPFLGTCGGFQHAVVEWARSSPGLADADHAETNPSGDHQVVTRLTCSLVGQQEEIRFAAGSQLHAVHGGSPSREDYHCNYGVNPDYRARLETTGLRFSGFDSTGQVRAFELPAHPFFVGTLYQPERSALQHRSHPLIQAFVAAAAKAGIA